MVHRKHGFGLALLGGVLFASAAFRAADKVQLQRKDKQVDVVVDGRPFTTSFFTTDVAKPYFRPLRSVQGMIVTRDFPIENTIPPEHMKYPSLEPHQRPMYFGHGNIDGIDFWGEAVFSHYSDDMVFGRCPRSDGRIQREAAPRCGAQFESRDGKALLRGRENCLCPTIRN